MFRQVQVYAVQIIVNNWSSTHTAHMQDPFGSLSLAIIGCSFSRLERILKKQD